MTDTALPPPVPARPAAPAVSYATPAADREAGVLAGPGPLAPGTATGRLLSLDAYRGFVMLLMMTEGLAIGSFVRNNPGAGAFWKVLAHHTGHVEWRGCTLWDLIQPSFTFIVGVAMPFSLAKRRARGQSFESLLLHAVIRSLILIGLGIFLRSVDKPLTYFTFEDTLTQIGLGYTFAFLLAWLEPPWQVAALVLILVGYWAAFAVYPAPAPGYDPLAVGVAPTWHASHDLHGFAMHWNKNTNLAAAFDRWFLNLFPRTKRFAFNAGGYQTLSFIPTLGTMLLGLLAGALMRSGRRPEQKILVLVGAGLAGLALGGVLDVTRVAPIVKRIWTPSWVIFSGGWACLLLAAFYAVIDWRGFRDWSFPLRVVGMNSIAAYCLADGGFRSWVQSALRTHMNTFLHMPAGAWLMNNRLQAYGTIVNWTASVLVLWLVLYWMYRRKIFLRI